MVTNNSKSLFRNTRDSVSKNQTAIKCEIYKRGGDSSKLYSSLMQINDNNKIYHYFHYHHGKNNYHLNSNICPLTSLYLFYFHIHI